MSTNLVDAPARPAPSAASSVRRGLRGFSDRWSFQRKLNVLVGVPLMVIALLLTYLIVDLVRESNRAKEAAQLVRDSTQVARLVALLRAEHQQAVLLSVRHHASFDDGPPPADNYLQTQAAVDAQVRTVVDTFGDRLPETEAQALREVQGLASLRDTVEQGHLPADNIDPAYSNAADGLIDGLGLDHNSALATTFTGNLLDSLLRADAAHGAYETGVFSAGTGDSNALIEFNGAVGSYKLYTYQAERFERFATEAQTEELGGIEHNESQAEISRHYAELAVDPSALQADSQAEIRRAFRSAIASYPDYSAQSGARLTITASLIDQIADQADDAASSAEWRAGLLLNLALFGFIVWIVLVVLVRRSVIRPVLALTGAAQEVAEVAGRELARVADDDAEESGPPRLRELPVTADDEIGELAEAFNNVQTTAAALLERQVLSRRNVAEMFGNVGRRVSNLTTRQLALIDAVERGETDPALLERLYSIDHIAVRLRRNADSLMLLAGIRETVLDAGPSALTNVVRAALGQIEGYQRVRLHAGTEVMVAPDIIGDLTLMIAELLENAVSFSPQGSLVEVGVDADDDGATITVADHGLGMSAERLAEENARLVRRERLDLVPTKVLGLFVVGALARRWDVDVTLSRTPGGGVTAEVSIPSTLLLKLSGLGVPGADSSAATPGALPTASSPSAGPAPSRSLPAATEDDQEAGPLPRRVPRREVTGTEETHPEPVLTDAHDHDGAEAVATDAETHPHDGAEAVTTEAETHAPDEAGTVPTKPRTHDRDEAEGVATEAGTHARTAADAGAPTAHTHAETDTCEPPAHAHGADAHIGGAGTHTAEPSPDAGGPGAPARPVDGTRRTGNGLGTPAVAAHGPAGTGEPMAYARDTHAPAHRTVGGQGARTPGALPADTAGPAADAGRTAPDARGTAAPDARGTAAPDARGTAAPGARTGVPARPAADAESAGGSRPLRRRVRGATLRTTVDAAAQQAARRAVRPADADAVRSALEEFEAAVERAHRDTGGGTGEHPRPPAAHAADQNGPSGPSEPDEPGNRHDGNDRDDRNDRNDHGNDRKDHRRPAHHQNHLPEGAEQ